MRPRWPESGDVANLHPGAKVRNCRGSAGLLATIPIGPALRDALALALADRHRPGAACLRISVDAALGPFVQTYLSRIHMLARDTARAVETVRPQLTYPSWITPAELTTEPRWAPLRAHRAFESLVRCTDD